MELPKNAALIVNLFIILLFFICVFRGYKKGLINQIIGLFTLMLAGIIAWILYLPFGKLFEIIPQAMVPFQSTSLSEFFYEKSNAMLWFVIIFVVSLLIIKFIAKVLDVISRAPILNIINRLFGVAFSMINFALIIWVLTFALSLPFIVNGDEIKAKSLLKYQETIIENVLPFVSEPIIELASMQQVVKKPGQATTSDVENMQKWMLKNKVDLIDVISFFKEIENE